jgi:hypothetical protein
MLRNDADLTERATSPVSSTSPPNSILSVLRRMFAVHAHDRPSLLQLQSHPWLRVQVQPLDTNVAPQPIVFYRVPGVNGILKFRRRPVKPDPACLEKCKEFGVDPTTLVEQLKSGLTTADTATYFCCLYPLTEGPETRTIRQALSEPLMQSAGKPEIDDILLDPIATPVKRMSAILRPAQSPVVLFPHSASRGTIVKLALPRPVPAASKQRRRYATTPRKY